MQETALDTLVKPPGQGEGIWHLGVLWTLKVPSAVTNAGFSLAEQLLPAGFAPPFHRHTREDEAWIVLDGEVTFFLDDQAQTVGAGTYVYGPRNGTHTFRVESPTARVATLLVPGTSERFFHSTGRAAETLTLPPPQEPDLEALLAGMAEHGIEFISPPPH